MHSQAQLIQHLNKIRTFLVKRHEGVAAGSESGYYGTAAAVDAGYQARLDLIDKWIAAAHKKLLAAVFRKAADLLPDSQFMCAAVRHAVAPILGIGIGEAYHHALTAECQAILNGFAPQGAQYAWFPHTPRCQALRLAILNLCVTEVTRGFK